MSKWDESVDDFGSIVGDVLDGAVMWVNSTTLGWGQPPSLAATTCNEMLRMLVSHLRALAMLVRAGEEFVPTGLVAARSIFETGLTIAWVHEPANREQWELRGLALHAESAEWRGKVGRRLGALGGQAEGRWTTAADVQRAFVSQQMSRLGRPSFRVWSTCTRG